MSFRPRWPALLVAGLGTAVLVAACSEGPASPASSLAPTTAPSAGYALPRNCSTDAAGLPTSCDGLAGTGVAAREQLQVCKSYPQGTGPAVQITVDVRESATNRNRNSATKNSPTHLTYLLQPNSCVIVWQNGQDNGPDPDTLDVSEVGPAGYTATSQLTTIVRTTTISGDVDPTHYVTTTGPEVATTTVKDIIVGGPYVPGALLVFRNTPAPPPTYSIGDRVWDDADADGVQDAGENGLTGLTVTVTNAANAVVATTTTGANGAYSVGNLLAGTYTVCVSGVAAGYSPSYDLDGTATPGCATVTLAASRTDVDFGYYRLGAIGDFVWNDLNQNGIQDAGEPGIAGVAVTLTKGAATQTTTTNANGQYAFANLVAGTYTLTVSGTPIGFVASPSDVGTNDAIDSDGSGVAVVVAGASNTTVDFGFYEKIGGMACTYTQGYWKNHEESWPAPFSPSAQWMTAQKQVAGLTWDGLLGIPPKGGNSYVQLAHQWMAAKLNRANGAPTSAGVLQTLNAAEAWLLANTPTNGALPSIKNAQADAWMSALDNFNNGLSGTPHCD